MAASTGASGPDDIAQAATAPDAISVPVAITGFSGEGGCAVLWGLGFIGVLEEGFRPSFLLSDPLYSDLMG